MVWWIAEQSSLCLVRSVGVFFVFPPDLGGQVLREPTLLLALKQFQPLEEVNAARHGAGFPCELAGAERRRPWSILTNITAHHELLCMAWHILPPFIDLLHYDGPLPTQCPCSAADRILKGLKTRQQFQPPPQRHMATISGSPVSGCCCSYTRVPPLLHRVFLHLCHLSVGSGSWGL